jgi:hypothetical protein
MSDSPRLAAGFEAGALIRRAQVEGGFGMIIHKGDAERGSLLLVVLERGQHHAFIERSLGVGGHYAWGQTGPAAGDSDRVDQYIAIRRRSDPDCWVIELDVPSAERFIAETTSAG